VITGVIIAVAAILIFREAWLGFVAPRDIRADAVGLGISALATVINAAWAYVLVRIGRRARSPALIADGRHLFTDVLSTAGVLVGVLLVVLTGYRQLDAVLAALVGLAVLWSGWELIRQSVVGLMDVAIDPKHLQELREIIAANAEGAIEAHDVRTRRAGRMTFIDFHLVVPGAMTVEAAHAICDRIEAKLREAVDDALITIHVEPENKAKHSGIVVV
jgi:cation diffusion facilitator family transporter